MAEVIKRLPGDV